MPLLHSHPSLVSLLALAILASPAAAAQCSLYPIALHQSTLTGVGPGSTLSNVLNGSGTGNFGWLTWNGSPSTPTLTIKVAAKVPVLRNLRLHLRVEQARGARDRMRFMFG